MNLNTKPVQSYARSFWLLAALVGTMIVYKVAYDKYVKPLKRHVNHDDCDRCNCEG